jgi:putative N6-adenine-specific DNA methylase
LVAAELRRLPEVEGVEIAPGVVSFTGPRAALYRANLHLRCASRVLVQLADVPCRGPDDLYATAYGLPWEKYLHCDGTLAVAAHGEGPGLSNSMYAALRVKDAVVDRFRAHTGRRPNVDVARPDLRINVQPYEGLDERRRLGPRCALSLDSSDPPLHQRGYRRATTAAPLKETLAAAIISTALSRAGTESAEASLPLPIVDLCCGSGTLLIEAGMLALRRAPGLSRSFGFMRWRDFDAALWQRLLREAKLLAKQAERVTCGAPPPFLYGLDLDQKAVAAARRNIESAGLSPLSRIQFGDLRDAEAPPGGPGLVVCNPPYGERLLHDRGEDLTRLYGALGDTLKRRFAGYTAFVFTANLDLVAPIGLRPRARHIFYNGNLEGRLLELPLY